MAVAASLHLPKYSTLMKIKQSSSIPSQVTQLMTLPSHSRHNHIQGSNPSWLDRELPVWVGNINHHESGSGSGWAVKCWGWDSDMVLEADEKNMMTNIPEEEEEWMEMRGWSGKCKGRRGTVELLECLEKEAIMGEDEGRDPADYHRRARIFDKSSRVFQALKLRKRQRDAPAHHS